MEEGKEEEDRREEEEEEKKKEDGVHAPALVTLQRPTSRGFTAKAVQLEGQRVGSEDWVTSIPVQDLKGKHLAHWSELGKLRPLNL